MGGIVRLGGASRAPCDIITLVHNVSSWKPTLLRSLSGVSTQRDGLEETQLNLVRELIMAL